MAKDDKKGWDWQGMFHQIVTAVLTAGVLGGWWFFNNTNTELVLLRADITTLGAKIDAVATLIDEIHPRRPAPPPSPSPKPTP